MFFHPSETTTSGREPKMDFLKHNSVVMARGGPGTGWRWAKRRKMRSSKIVSTIKIFFKFFSFKMERKKSKVEKMSKYNNERG